MTSDIKTGPPKAGIGAKLFGSLFLLVFGLAGLEFCYVLGKQILRTAESYSWPEQSCQIEESRVIREFQNTDDTTPYRIKVRYAYQVGGNERVGTSFSTNSNEFSSYDEAAAKLSAIAPEGSAPCFINPKDPSDAILKHQSLWSALLIFLPLIFVGFGFGGLYFIWSKDRSASSAKVSSIAKTKRRSFSLKWIGWLLLGGGAIASYYMVGPAYKALASTKWQKERCRVIDSDVIRHESSDDDGRTSYTYSIDIFYRYWISGKEYQSSRYQFFSGSSSGRSGKQAVVSKYPSGSTVDCWVNPNNPGESVLAPGLGLRGLLLLIPAVLLLIGYGVLKSKPVTLPQSGAAVSPRSNLDRFARAPSGRAELKPSMSARVTFIFILLATLFWNGIVFAITFNHFSSKEFGVFSLFQILFFVPFIFVGLLLIAITIYFFLAMFNPRVTLEISNVSPELGETIEISWRTTGRIQLIKVLRITIVGQEEASYRRGTDQVTERSVFARNPVFETTNSTAIQQGRASFTLPLDSMHSFSASNNKIIWKIELQGEISRWPDISQEYVVSVGPRRS